MLLAVFYPTTAGLLPLHLRPCLHLMVVLEGRGRRCHGGWKQPAKHYLHPMANYDERLHGAPSYIPGATVEIVEEVLADRSQLEELFNCYRSDDETVLVISRSATATSPTNGLTKLSPKSK